MLHILFYLNSEVYSPLHLITKSTIIMHNHFLVVLIIMIPLVGYWLLFRIPKSLDKRMDYQWIFYALPLGVASIGDLAFRIGYDGNLVKIFLDEHAVINARTLSWGFSGWEGANYLIPSLIPSLSFVIKRECKYGT